MSNIFEAGFSPELDRTETFLQPAFNVYSDVTTSGVSSDISPTNLASGAMASVLFSGKETFDSSVAGYRMGVNLSDNIYKWIIGDSTASIDWAVTTASTLTVVGAFVATSATINGSTLGFQNLFGDGSDGSLSLSGAGTTTLTSDKYYTDVTIDSSRILKTNGFALFVSGTLTINTEAYIDCSGNSSNNGQDATGGSGGNGGIAGAALSSNRYYGSLAGTAGGDGADGTNGAGAAGSAGSAGGATTNSIHASSVAVAGVAGGAGGSGGSAGGAGGAGGAAGAFTSSSSIKPRNAVDAIQMLDHDGTPTMAFIKGSPSNGGSGGGGAGGGNGGATVGGGGGGGGAAGGNAGTIVICAKTISYSSSSAIIRVIGGDGGDGGTGGDGFGSGASGGGGGGAGDGGNGGNVLILYSQDVSGVLSSKIDVSGGNSGNAGVGGASGGGVGSAGSDGTGASFGADGKKILLKI